MKKLTFLTAIVVLFTGILTLNAQIRIASNNNVGIGVDNPVSKLSIGDVGNTYSKAYIFNSNTGTYQRALQVYQAKVSSSWGYGLHSSIEQGTTGGLLIGTFSSAYRGSTAYTQGRTTGVKGQSGNATSGWNYAVYGELLGSNNGAAIFGTVPGKGDVNTLGMYAGYFRGDVKMENNLYVLGSYNPSDMELKKDVRFLESNNIEKLKQLQAIKYKIKTPVELNLFTKEVTDTAKVLMSKTELNDPIYKNDYIGLSAQDVQKVFPEIVKADNNGYLSVNYTGLIPVLIEAIKEQQLKIEELEEQVAKLSVTKLK